MWLALLALLAASPERPFAEERLLLDRRLETLRRILPDGPRATADDAVVRELANAAHLQEVATSTRPPVETGAQGEVVVDLAAVGRFAEVERFFRQAALSHRLIDVESLQLTATPEDTVKLAAVLRFPYRPAKAPLPPPPEGLRNRWSGLTKAQSDAFLRDQALALAKSEAVASLRRNRRNPRVFLAELSSIARDRPVTLSFAGLGDVFVVRGLAAGQGPVRALESRFERGFLRVSEFLMRRQGSCVQFEVRGGCPVAGAEADLPLPTDDPFVQDDQPCRVDRDSSRGFTAKGPGKRGKGPLTLRLRDVDLADVFRVLHLLTGQGFLVDGDVTGRLSAELAGVTPAEAIAAIQKAAGLKVSEAGPLRRVSRGDPGKLPATGAGGPATSFRLKRAEVRDILAVMTDLDASLATLGPQGSLGRLSLWAADAPLLDLRAAVLQAVGLRERVEEGRRILERTADSPDPVFPVGSQAPDRRLVLRPQDITVGDFDLAGVATSGDGYRAFAYAPNGVLDIYKAGDRLVDGVVKSVDSTDIVLETEDGPVRILVPPLR